MTNTESRPGQMDIARTCGSPPGLSETWTKVKAAKLPERWPGQQDVGRVPFSNAFPFPGLLLRASDVRFQRLRIP
ncbi:MAG: hypothetical protein KKB51_25035 [Candidatus Riflebacteria bacterium]|nr:hypothetical protein [Candidatus Riflebacteria bacterium]